LENYKFFIILLPCHSKVKFEVAIGQELINVGFFLVVPRFKSTLKLP
jgi:hypothetical protein